MRQSLFVCFFFSLVKWRKMSFYSSLLLLLLSCFSRVWKSSLCDPRDGRQPTRLPRPWDSPGKNTGVGCHFLLQCMKVKIQSEFAQSCLTPRDPMDCSLSGSSVHGIHQARVLEWVAIALSVFKSNIKGVLLGGKVQFGVTKVPQSTHVPAETTSPPALTFLTSRLKVGASENPPSIWWDHFWSPTLLVPEPNF